MMIPALADVALFAWYIGVLVLLEGLLSADNALVLAVMVRHLPKNQQQPRALLGDLGGCRVPRAGPLAGVGSLAFLDLQGHRRRLPTLPGALSFLSTQVFIHPLRGWADRDSPAAGYAVFGER